MHKGDRFNQSSWDQAVEKHVKYKVPKNRQVMGVPFYGKAEKELARRNMERMGISAMAKRCYRELSGGQQQRVLLARALCATQKLLLMDEPVSGLDPLVTAEMYELIRKLNREGVTCRYSEG